MVECIYKCRVCGGLNTVNYKGKQPPPTNWALLKCEGCHIPENHLEKWVVADLEKATVCPDEKKSGTDHDHDYYHDDCALCQMEKELE